MQKYPELVVGMFVRVASRALKPARGRHYVPARVVAVNGEFVEVKPLHNYPGTEMVRRRDVRCWKSKQVTYGRTCL